MDADCGSGTTTQQMLAAPKCALYVWVNRHLDYPRLLAKHLNRADLEIVSPGTLDDASWRGRRLTGVVLDHAACLNDREWRVLRKLTEAPQWIGEGKT